MRLSFIDKSDFKIADVRTLISFIKNDSINIAWAPSQWNRGHKLYQLCYEEFKSAFNSKYQLIYTNDRIILKNTFYSFVLVEE